MPGKHILIVGAGSVGKRHAQNLANLGSRTSFVDPRPDRRQEAADITGTVNTYDDMASAFGEGAGFDGVVIASPTAFHVEQAMAALENKIPVLLEKPVSRNADEAQQLLEFQQDCGIPVLLGYTWRWWPPLVRVRELLAAKVIGKLHSVRFVMGAHLEDWHPWEAYQDFFMANQALGGGALLDESHWLDLMLWLFGMPAGLYAHVEKISSLEISSDDNVDMIIVFPDNLRVTIHLDLYSRPHEKYIRFIGENGTLLWTVEPNRVAVSSEMSENWESTEFECERNDMFALVAREFLDVIDGNPVRTCTLQDGVNVMRLIEAARASHQQGQFVETGSE